MATYKAVEVTVSGGTVTVGSGSTSSVVSIADSNTSDENGSSQHILGDISSDTFTVSAAINGVTSFTYVGSVIIGSVTGFVALGSDGNDYFFEKNTATTPASGSTGSLVSAVTGNLTSNGNYNVTTGALACFVEGTLIATPSGDVAVETLKAGDLVLTATGAAAPIRWLGRSTVSMFFADPMRVTPVQVKAGALGENLPQRDLFVSPGHALAIDGVLVHAAALVNGTSVVRDADPAKVFAYFHIELDSHQLILAEGVAAETFLDGAEDMGFDNWNERPAAPAEATELDMPRVKSARQLPASVRNLLAARAGVIGADLAIAA